MFRQELLNKANRSNNLITRVIRQVIKYTRKDDNQGVSRCFLIRQHLAKHLAKVYKALRCAQRPAVGACIGCNADHPPVKSRDLKIELHPSCNPRFCTRFSQVSDVVRSHIS